MRKVIVLYYNQMYISINDIFAGFFIFNKQIHSLVINM